MQFYVYLYQEKNEQSIKKWGEPNSLNRDGKYDFGTNWADSAIQLAQQAQRQGNEFPPTHIFLSFTRDHLLRECNPKILEQVLKQSIQHFWGNPIYLSLRDDLILFGEVMKKEIPVCDIIDWFDIAHRFRVESIYHAHKHPSPGNPVFSHMDKYISLWKRRTAKVSLKDEWKCLLPDEYRYFDYPKNLFKPYYIDDSEIADYSGNLLIVTKFQGTENRKDYIKNRLSLCPKNKKQIVSVGGAIDESDPDLFFHGPLELLYFLKRLNHEKSLNPANKRPHILLTSSFNPNDLTDKNELEGKVNCLVAANYIGKFIHQLPTNAVYRVHPALESIFLPDILEKEINSSLSAWVHLGHGEKDEGLQNASSRFEKAEVWAQRFYAHQNKNYERKLALFLSCESAAVAEHFVREKIFDCAIGFKAKVLPKACYELGYRVLEKFLVLDDVSSLRWIYDNVYAELRARGLDAGAPEIYP